MNSPRRMKDLLPSERTFLSAMRRIRFGRLEHLQIVHGEIVLDPWPVEVRTFEFGAESASSEGLVVYCNMGRNGAGFFGLIRTIAAGEILTLKVEDGEPVSAEIKQPKETHQWVM